ncbi:hypothetical protein AQUCO_01300659v1 [Aquilegia coerulea]|uniref:Uncharacterized protein n=1 Tax=Aquilegia coerulea TaxID=218851 RepID=A0A2G5E2U3_AQUCA|nr:hypothetical protein AQUCO_01300659v1 [Aquilegia coerulea]
MCRREREPKERKEVRNVVFVAASLDVFAFGHYSDHIAAYWLVHPLRLLWNILTSRPYDLAFTLNVIGNVQKEGT